MPHPDGLPVDLDDLLHTRAIESHRVEFKATWIHPIRRAVVKTVCAFANDVLNLNGGYIVLGVEESGGRPMLPPRGLDDLDIDVVHKDVVNACRSLEPAYVPLLFPVTSHDKTLLVIWAPGGDTRPYQAPDDVNQKGGQKLWWVRQGPMTVEAKGLLLQQLLEQTAKVPFDDRRNNQARVDDISPRLVRAFLHDVRSRLLDQGEWSDERLYERMRLLFRVNGHSVPRNVALLFFNEEPERFFPSARIEVVHFQAGGDSLEERNFTGPVHIQLRDVLRYLDTRAGALLQKVAGQAEVDRTEPYPFAALEEALVNAVYHRGYDGTEPVKVYLFPDRVQIISYPGPVHGIEPSDFESDHGIPPVPARNRRIGELLKELRLSEGRGTGIPKIVRAMKENGNPAPRFRFGADRSYFMVELPVHPRSLAQ